MRVRIASPRVMDVNTKISRELNATCKWRRFDEATTYVAPPCDLETFFRPNWEHFVLFDLNRKSGRLTWSNNKEKTLCYPLLEASILCSWKIGSQFSMSSRSIVGIFFFPSSLLYGFGTRWVRNYAISGTNDTRSWLGLQRNISRLFIRLLERANRFEINDTFPLGVIVNKGKQSCLSQIYFFTEILRLIIKK